MPIYHVEAVITMVIEADDLAGAEHSAPHAAKAFIYDDPAEVRSITQIHALSELPGNWDGKCFPYSTCSNLRLEEILPE
ncbi:hypothetical protein [Pseudomonas chlororaphis]|uniref:hypothetical protein n=1 Tax=Pseudomonas chlororaphis TaxID=587753 RepID=UPI000BE34D67|nr:hypothetical protein [Pseudomonas chlororaphis]